MSEAYWKEKYNIESGCVAKQEFQISALKAENAALKEQLEKAQKDADRYRWLRKCESETCVVTNRYYNEEYSGFFSADDLDGAELDAAIDKAREAGK